MDPDDLERKLLSRGKRMRAIPFVLGALVVLSVITPCGICLFRFGKQTQERSERREIREAEREARMRNASPEERTMARDAVQRVRDAIPAHREKWHAGIAAGRDAVGSDRPCAIQPTVRASMSTNGGSFGSMADALEALRYADGRTAYPFALESGEVTPPRIALAESEFISDILPSIQGRVDGDRLDSFLERARSLDSFWSFDVLVVPERYHPPLASADGQSFTPGEFEGRALVYSYVEDRVVCSAAFRAQSAARSVHFSAQLAMESIELMRILLADFNVEIERHAALALRQRGAIEDNAIEEDLPE